MSDEESTPLAPAIHATLGLAYLARANRTEVEVNRAAKDLLDSRVFQAAVQALSVEEAVELRAEVRKISPALAVSLVDFIRLERAFEIAGQGGIPLGVAVLPSSEAGIEDPADDGLEVMGVALLIEPEEVVGLRLPQPVAITAKAGAFYMPSPGNYKETVFGQGGAPAHVYLAAALAEDYGYTLAPWVMAFRDEVASLADRVCRLHE